MESYNWLNKKTIQSLFNYKKINVNISLLITLCLFKLNLKLFKSLLWQ